MLGTWHSLCPVKQIPSDSCWGLAVAADAGSHGRAATQPAAPTNAKCGQTGGWEEQPQREGREDRGRRTCVDSRVRSAHRHAARSANIIRCPRCIKVFEWVWSHSKDAKFCEVLFFLFLFLLFWKLGSVGFFGTGGRLATFVPSAVPETKLH